MGQGIVYCFKCSSRIVGADSDKGVGYTIGDRIACAECASTMLPTLPQDQREDLLARMSKTTSAKSHAPTRRTPSRGTEAVPPSRPEPTKTPLIVAGVVGGVVLLLLFVVLSRNDPPRLPDPVPQERRAELPRPVPVEAPKPKESFDAELARIDDSIAGVMRQEGFKEALDYLASARKRHDAPEWTLAIDRRLGKTNDDIQALFTTLQTKAVDARRRGSEPEVKAIVDQVARWNLPDRAATLKKTLEATVVSVAFKQGADGIVCIEAEHFAGRTEAGGHAWTPTQEPAGFQGEGAMSATPNDGGLFKTDYAAKSPKLEYRIEFARAGPHFLWVRAAADTDADNSVHAGLDGDPLPSLCGIAWSATKKWVWANKRTDGKLATFTVAAPGIHTFQLWVREDGAAIDRFVITSDPKWTPKGNGPAESPR
jgi:hypothetical protein